MHKYAAIETTYNYSSEWEFTDPEGHAYVLIQTPSENKIKMRSSERSPVKINWFNRADKAYWGLSEEVVMSGLFNIVEKNLL